jgi:predicted RecA/RadA family phage recombinase
MSKTDAYVPASELSLPVPAATKSGSPVKIGSLVGVTATARGEGGNLPTHASVLMDDRAYVLPVDGAITGPGQPIYIVAADNTLTVTAGSNTLFGYSVSMPDNKYASKATGVGPALVKLAKV